MIKIDRRSDDKTVKLYFNNGESLCIFMGPSGDIYFDPVVMMSLDMNYKGIISLYINRDEEIYKYFDAFYQNIINSKNENANIITGEKIILYSESYKKEEASSLSIFKENDNIKLNFNCSNKPYSCRSYFVMIKSIDSVYFPYNKNFSQLFKDLVIYAKTIEKPKVLRK